MPNLFVIGAMKCGTTSLHYYLDLHPEISMSVEKEPNYFIPEGFDWIDRDVGDRDSYLSLFRADTAIRGEASTNYSRYPIIPGVPEAIAREAPDAKIVYLVRDPVDRIEAEVTEVLSGRRREFKYLPADIPVEEVLGDLDAPGNRFIPASQYMTQIRGFLRFFPRDSLLIINSDMLRSRRVETMSAIFRFLGVDEGFRDERIERELNRAADKRRRSEFYVRLSEMRLLQAVIERMPPRARRDSVGFARRNFSTPWTPPRIDPQLRSRLEQLFIREVEELREFTGQDFPGWSI